MREWRIWCKYHYDHDLTNIHPPHVAPTPRLRFIDRRGLRSCTLSGPFNYRTQSPDNNAPQNPPPANAPDNTPDNVTAHWDDAPADNDAPLEYDYNSSTRSNRDELNATLHRTRNKLRGYVSRVGNKIKSSPQRLRARMKQAKSHFTKSILDRHERVQKLGRVA
jgi:hypothetical protein